MPASLAHYLASVPKELSEINDLLEDTRKIFKTEPNIIKIQKSPCLFIGDTHGDFQASQKIIKKFLHEENLTLIFLGDYVDRGANQLENVNFLFHMKREYPKRILLLRGNHEEEEMNHTYGFVNLLSQKFGETATEVFTHFLQAFAQLPLCVLTWNQILGVHGGIPVSVDNTPITLKQIAQLKRGATHFEQFDPITAQLLWNDPKESVGDAVPSARGIGYYFGKREFKKFIEANDIHLIIRSHEVFQEGYKKFFDNQIISIFSALYYVYLKGIDAKIVRLDTDGDIKLLNIRDLD